MLQTIDIELIPHKFRKNIQQIEGFLKLHDDYVEYKMSANFDQINDDGLCEFKETNYRWIRKRQSISGLEMFHDNSIEKWVVEMEFSGTTTGLSVSYESPKEALKLYNKLYEYYLMTP